jgi:hypothetical protein
VTLGAVKPPEGRFLLLGNGDGTLAPSIASPTTVQRLRYETVGDYNGDGHPDLVVTGRGGTSVLLGNGDGSFGAPTNYATGMGGRLTAGDVNGDGHPDVVVSNYAKDAYNPATLVLLLGNGDGTLATSTLPRSVLLGNAATGVALADLNGDRHEDLVGTSGNGNMSIYFGNGDGTFQAPVNFAGVQVAQGVVVLDLNGDGKMDLATTGLGASVRIFIGNGGGTFQAPVAYAPGDSSILLEVRDMNLDGKPDLVTANGVGRIQVLHGNGDGTFTNGADAITVTEPSGFDIRDLNGDGKPDIVAATGDYPFIEILLHE